MVTEGTQQPKQTLGQRRVRASFNPSLDPSIDFIKDHTAELIDFMDNVKQSAQPVSSEKLRLASLAQTAYEEAAMWAVKALTE